MIGRTPAQRELLRFFLTVVALEVVAIGAFYAADIEHASSRTRTAYMLVWMAATLVIVMTGLRRVRLARLGDRGGRRPR
jgi:hypothetical protein